LPRKGKPWLTFEILWVGLGEKVVAKIKEAKLMTNLRIFIVGAGAIARHHAKSIQKLTNYQNIPLFVADPHPPTLAEFAGQFPKARCFADSNTMLAVPAQADDLVIVATPPFLHFELAAQALQSGRHVLCEKPLVVNSSQALELLEIARASHKLLADCSSRFVGVPSTEQVKKLLAEQVLGELYHLTWVNKWQRSRPGIEYQPVSKWFLDKAKSGGGPLLDWASYEFSTLNDLFQPTHVEVVHAWITRPQTGADPKDLVFDIETHGGATMLYYLPDGQRVTINYERSNGTHGAERQFFEIEGTKGALSWDWMMFKPQVELKLSRDEEGKVATQTFVVEGDKELTLHDRPLHYIVRAMEGKPNQAIVNEQAIFNFLCAQALYRVAQTGKPATVYRNLDEL
jgi:predicted dehydrogenase